LWFEIFGAVTQKDSRRRFENQKVVLYHTFKKGYTVQDSAQPSTSADGYAAAEFGRSDFTRKMPC